MNSFQDRNGGVTTYAFSFPSIAVTDIKVTVDDVEQTYLTHYQVDSYSTTSGGTVNFSVGGALATYKNTAGATVTGTPPATQPLNVRIYRQTKLINTSTGLAAPEADFTPGSSIRAADLDNIVKPLLDTYQSIFEEFNDNKVYHIKLTKQITNKGDEYLYVKVERYIDAIPLTVVNNEELLERTVQSGKL